MSGYPLKYVVFIVGIVKLAKDVLVFLNCEVEINTSALIAFANKTTFLFHRFNFFQQYDIKFINSLLKPFHGSDYEYPNRIS